MGLPSSTLVLGVLPGVLDTPANRAAMGGPGTDTSTWTPPADIALAIEAWCEQHAGRQSVNTPLSIGVQGGYASGSLLRVETSQGKSSWVLS